MITLAFLLDHQVISRSDKNTVVAGSKNYVRARFVLRTDDWARPITAIFGGYTQLLDDNNECTVPWEVLQQPGKVLLRRSAHSQYCRGACGKDRV